MSSSLPSMNVFGLHPKSENIQKYYIPHFAEVPNIYPNSRLSRLPVDSVMFTRNAWAEVDFWNSDADILYVEDSLSFVDALSTTGNHYSYFDPFLKIYRVAHSDIVLRTHGSTKNDNHVLDILNNFIRADLIWVSPILAERFVPVLRSHFSKSTREAILKKFVSLPYPSFYRTTTIPYEDADKLRIAPGKPLVFLWNHRLVENKNYKDFCRILENFKEKYPEIKFKILYVCAEPEQNIMKATPKALHDNVEYVGFISDKVEYRKAILRSNITLSTSKLESFGNSVFDSISSGVLLLNQDCNDALVYLLGDKYTWSREELPDIIAEVYRSKSLRNAIHKYNTEGMERIPGVKRHQKILSGRITECMDLKFEKAPSLEKSKIVQTALEALAKKTLTKRELYQAVGWTVSKNPLNAHWAGYYYALRREGVKTTVVDGVLYFHTSEKPKVSKTTSSVANGAWTKRV